MLICGLSFDDFLCEVEEFHGWKAPGIVLGGFMVDWARELIGQGEEPEAIVETSQCLPDAIQILTPCTIGNGMMKILDWGKFALSLYDVKKSAGYRVWLDTDKAKSFPNLYNWYMRLIPKDELPLEVVVETILDAGRTVLSSGAVHVIHLKEHTKKAKTAVCPGCREAYPSDQGSECLACQGKAYYRFSDKEQK